VHAVQLEMCQSLYMQEAPPYDYDRPLAAQVQPVLRDMVAGALHAARRCMSPEAALPRAQAWVGGAGPATCC
jgi:N-formylglutamate amidohydrolase